MVVTTSASLPLDLLGSFKAKATHEALDPIISLSDRRLLRVRYGFGTSKLSPRSCLFDTGRVGHLHRAHGRGRLGYPSR